jgi:cellobiose phosphorylase
MSKKFLTAKAKETRYKNRKETIILYVPNEEQYKKIYEIVKETISSEELTGQVTPQCIKTIYEDLTSLSEEVRDITIEEFIALLNQKVFVEKDREMIRLYREVEKLLKEICEDISYEVETQLDETISLLKSVDIKKKEQEILELADKFLGENGEGNKIKEVLEKYKQIKELEQQVKDEELIELENKSIEIKEDKE